MLSNADHLECSPPSSLDPILLQLGKTIPSRCECRRLRQTWKIAPTGGVHHLTKSLSSNPHLALPQTPNPSPPRSCGNVSVPCLSRGAINPAAHGVMVQTWGNGPFVNPACKADTCGLGNPLCCEDREYPGAYGCCTQGCEVIAHTRPEFDLIDPSNPATGGILLLHNGMMPVSGDPVSIVTCWLAQLPHCQYRLQYRRYADFGRTRHRHKLGTPPSRPPYLMPPPHRRRAVPRTPLPITPPPARWPCGSSATPPCSATTSGSQRSWRTPRATTPWTSSQARRAACWVRSLARFPALGALSALPPQVAH